jgi:outer membrane immunogenic protein
MKRILLASVAALGLAGTASAADLGIRAPIVAPIPVFSWTGCYIGVHGGYGKGQSSHGFQFDDVRFPNDEPEYRFTNNFENKGGVYGLQGGCDYQVGRFVFGAEGDYSWANLKASYTAATDPTEVESESFSSKVSSLSSIRGRFGLAEDRALLYATMGWAWAKFKYSYALTDVLENDFNAASISSTVDGIVLGAGVNYALTDWLILRAEYLHYAFGKNITLTPGFPVTDIGPGFNDNVTLHNVDVIRVGADWKFNFWGAPAVARY